MGFEQAQKAWGLALAVVVTAVYLVVVAARAVTDGLPLAEVAWQGPMLCTVVAGGVLYGVARAVAGWRLRGRILVDERDVAIGRRAEEVGSGLTGLAVLVVLVMLALDAEPFWVAHVLFLGSFLGSVAGTGAALAAYRDGLP
ncbi:MAG: hypothetical protein U0Q15_18005 [Kineosporiaceae bacterium]